MSGGIHLVRTFLMTNFSTPPPPLTPSFFPLYIYEFGVTPLLLAYTILLIWYSALPFWLCSFAIVSSYCLSSYCDFVSDTHHFLASHPVSSSLPRKAFSLMVASNCTLFYLSRLLTKLSYTNAKGSYSRKTTTVIVTVLTKVLSSSYETATAITLSNSNNNNNNSIKQAL